MNINGVPTTFSVLERTHDPDGPLLRQPAARPDRSVRPPMSGRGRVRLPNAVLRKVFRLAVAATPVVIKP
jgi:hypothetical protein